jgi:hypothetical protein
MTQDKNFKRLVRERMAATGESYTAARAALARSNAVSRGTHPLRRDARIFVTGHRGLVGSALLGGCVRKASPTCSPPAATSSTSATKQPSTTGSRPTDPSM